MGFLDQFEGDKTLFIYNTEVPIDLDNLLVNRVGRRSLRVEPAAQEGDQALDPVAATPVLNGNLGGSAPLLGAARLAMEALPSTTLNFEEN
ncbi:hypothetical protein [Actinomyces minihominis]|uniref:hypothetical protein n=1 Tax=Actinomyces minihominis TaxID=2002838 RepID=UPI000C08A7B6|nr:hypothetical protein [Actinomyces minihominis]